MKKTQTNTVVKNEDNSMILPIEMRVRSLGDGERSLATLSANIGGGFAVRGIRLQEGKNGPFLSFPSYKGQNGYVDICFPIISELRQRMTDLAVDAYNQALSQHQTQSRQQGEQQIGEAPDQEVDLEQEPEIGMQMG